MQVEQRHKDAAADYCEANGELEACLFIRRGHDHPLVQAFARFEVSLPPSAPVDQDAWAELLCDNFEARLIAEQVEAPLYRDSEPHVQAYWQALASLATPSVLAESTSNDCLLVAEGWQDIASAPKDGTTVDLWWYGVRLVDCFWMNASDAFPDRLVGWVCTKSPKEPFHLSEICAEPTHWRPLPAPPAVTDLSGVGVG